MNETNFYFDTEFTGLTQDTKLLSIGIVAETGDRFYAEISSHIHLTDDEWIKENVIAKMICGGNAELEKELGNHRNTDVHICVSKKELAYFLQDWIETVLDKVSNESIDMDNNDHIAQFVSDVSHYDFVLLCDLFGGAMKLPEFISPCCHDINQDLAELTIEGIETEYDAFDANREELLEKLSGDPCSDNFKHNALHDAIVIKELYEIIYC